MRFYASSKHRYSPGSGIRGDRPAASCTSRRLTPHRARPSRTHCAGVWGTAWDPGGACEATNGLRCGVAIHAPARDGGEERARGAPTDHCVQRRGDARCERGCLPLASLAAEGQRPVPALEGPTYSTSAASAPVRLRGRRGADRPLTRAARAAAASRNESPRLGLDRCQIVALLAAAASKPKGRRAGVPARAQRATCLKKPLRVASLRATVAGAVPDCSGALVVGPPAAQVAGVCVPRPTAHSQRGTLRPVRRGW